MLSNVPADTCRLSLPQLPDNMATCTPSAFAVASSAASPCPMVMH